ncbi:DUF6054 family protein [Paludicola sp. MB14-C6]|uniref:DUF6054 family protein n=1 Tax=Paludihabitans sp. MB14-C6 TaxID=3070656 RepID=UPI0027DD8ACE|nr:DUF6054 family protein [Paludicola sp. MB14-C6]WMJ24082.1 DUF6054 family protein [Paludicola sp. MB14-C6]
MASVSFQGEGNLQIVINAIQSSVLNSGMSCELIDQKQHTYNNGNVTFMVFEKYYMRSSNRASLSVLVTQIGNSILVDAIASGGGQGALFKFSWGAEDDFLYPVLSALKRLNFSEI